MTNDYFRGLGTADRLWHVASNPNAATFAYDRLAVCRLAAQIQMRRLWKAAAASRFAAQDEPRANASLAEIRAFVADAKERMAPLIYETHYYFVAWSNCGNMLRVLTGQPEFLEAKKVFDSYRKHFEHYTAGRNSFEHYHDRLPGNTEEKKVREVVQSIGAGRSRIYFGFNGGEFKHSDMSWNITSTSLDLLEKAIDDTLAVLHRHIDELFVAKFGAA
jgi:hypothetical protein